MPVLLEENEVRIEWTDIEGRKPKPKPKRAGVRSSGVHLSGVIRTCLVATGDLAPAEIRTEEMPLRMAVGMAVEDWFVGLWPDLKWQPGECCLDGVYGSPDGITGTVLEEFKATWRSRRTYGADIPSYKLWMWQLAGYCKMLRLTQARMHVLWVCGDYKQGPPTPVYVTYRLSFTQEEIDNFWQKIVLPNRDAAPREEH